ncbi:hypothetical protein B0A79_14975 [Flavobacterium piscis]|uniref:Uncharacterized protein n=1 Tax=Flavobacterium piscis TaxID=1114874 RepID=A0ABX2XNN3_9FLAO|nr:hypothetical protein [Flavobacterium piscis]OCB71831.1 hypothetical protein FLP_14985 [Flavobacterium piscis]OXG03165.1 hypothetical protein B0A79_14975 [Flavobacterium piscis]
MKDKFKISDKELLTTRNTIFKDYGIPELEKNGFVRSPFKTSWYGEYDSNIRGYSYELCKLTDQNHLLDITVDIMRESKYIKIDLNIFELHEKINSISDLKECDGIHFHLPPNDSTRMQLRSDDYKGPPLFYMLFLPEYKIGKYTTQGSFEKQLNKLRNLVIKDMANIDSFVKRWHELHKPNITDKEGNIVKKIN